MGRYWAAEYDFISYDVENSLPFDDGQYTIILNTTADTADLPENLRNLFDYINTMNVAEADPGITKLDEAVQLLNVGEARREIMLWEHEIANKEYRARKEGKAEGLIEGKAEGLIEGKVEGRAEGELQAKRDIAYKLLQEGLTFDKVSAFTGLSEIELNTILESKQNSLWSVLFHQLNNWINEKLRNSGAFWVCLNQAKEPVSFVSF